MNKPLGGKIRSWYNDQPEVQNFVDENKEFIESYAYYENMSITKAIDIFYPKSTGQLKETF